MPDNPFDLFDAVEAEVKPIRKTIKGEKFEFPGAPPADVALRFYTALMVDPNTNVGLLAVFCLEQMMGSETLERLTTVTSLDGIEALAVGLFTHYGLIQKTKDGPADPKA